MRSPHATSAAAQQAVIEQSVAYTAETVVKVPTVQGLSSRSDAGGDSGGTTAGPVSLTGVSTVSTGTVSTLSPDGAVSVGAAPVRLKKP